MERLENCQRQSGMDCRNCNVAADIARNVLSKPSESVVKSINEVALETCPIGTKFLLVGDFAELIEIEEKVIQLKTINGEFNTNTETSAAEAAGL